MDRILVKILNGGVGYGIGRDTIWTEKIIPKTEKALSDIEFYRTKGVEIDVKEIDTFTIEAEITDITEEKIEAPEETIRCKFQYPTGYYCKNNRIEGSDYCDKHTD